MTRLATCGTLCAMHSHAAVARSWRWIAIALGLCLAAGAPLGCGSSSPSKDPDGAAPGEDAGGDAGPAPLVLSCEGASGTRVRQVLREHGDGTSEFIRLHDTDFVETCSFATAGDGALRCLPLVDGFPFAAGEVRYSDVECGTPIAQMAATAGVPAPTHMVEQVPPTDACAAPTPAFHVLGASLPIAPDAAIFQRQGKACVQLLAPATSFFAITGELPADSFIEGTETFTDSGRIAVSQVDGADGSRFCRTGGQFHDRDLGDHPCLLQISADGTSRCLPGDVAATQEFTNVLCDDAIEVALVDEVCNAAAAYLRDSAGAECPLRQRVRALEGALSEPLFVRVGKACEPAPAEPVAHGIGAEVSAFSFAEIGFDPIAAGGDRLERIDLASEDGMRIPSGRWLDTELDIACSFVVAADGQQRCLPVDDRLERTARTVSLFTEETCTTAAIVVGERDPSCASGDPLFILEAIAGRTRVYEAGPAQPGPLYQLGKTCAELPAGTLYHQLGPEILAQTFVGGTEMVD
jgi:hypothetical protein